MSEWWGTIGQPFIEDLLTLDTKRIHHALVNLPRHYYDYIHGIYVRSPEHVIIETFLILFVIYILFIKRDKPKKAPLKLSEKEIQELIDEWEPEPMVPKTHLEKTQPFGVLENRPGTHMKLQGMTKPVLNLATFDFLGLGSRPELKEVAIKTLMKYGCGSCGPRGFYGTIDIHEQLEQDLAEMMGTPDSITFSDTEATSSSVLPAFAKRGDLIVVDDGCNDSILVGANLARCTTHYYKHNDVEDLERVLKSIREADRRAGRRSDCQRRYVVTEALFRNHGDLVDLPKVVELCSKYYFRLFLDESFSFGVLGAHGRGSTEHFNIPVSNVAIMCGSLATAAAGVGGFSTGAREVVDYQRLNSAGYVFSASAPPFTSACTSEAIRLMRTEPELFTRLRTNAELVHDVLSSSVASVCTISKDRCSPIIHLRVLPTLLESVEGESAKKEVQRLICEQIMINCLVRGIAVCAPRYKTNQAFEPLPSVRITVTAAHPVNELKEACKVITTECLKVVKDELKVVGSTPNKKNRVELTEENSSGMMTRQRRSRKES